MHAGINIPRSNEDYRPYRRLGCGRTTAVVTTCAGSMKDSATAPDRRPNACGREAAARSTAATWLLRLARNATLPKATSLLHAHGCGTVSLTSWRPPRTPPTAHACIRSARLLQLSVVLLLVTESLVGEGLVRQGLGRRAPTQRGTLVGGQARAPNRLPTQQPTGSCPPA